MPSTKGILLSNDASIITVIFIWVFFFYLHNNANMGVKMRIISGVRSNHLVSVDAELQNLNLWCEHQSFQFYVKTYVQQLKYR